MSHWPERHEISHREREDEEQRWEHDFGVQEYIDEDERDKQLRGRDAETWTEDR